MYNNDDDDFDVVALVRAVAAERALPPAQIALAWLLGKPAVTAPIVGATKLRHLEDAIAAVDVTLSEDEVARLEAPTAPTRSSATTDRQTLRTVSLVGGPLTARSFWLLARRSGVHGGKRR